MHSAAADEARGCGLAHESPGTGVTPDPHEK